VYDKGLTQQRSGIHAKCRITIAGRGSAWLERLVRDQEVAGSNPVAPIY
jgi:hypothetical protein